MMNHPSAVLRAWASAVAVALTMRFSPHRKRHALVANVHWLGSALALALDLALALALALGVAHWSGQV